MRIFSRNNTLKVNLNNLSLKELFDLPKYDNVDIEEFYINNVVGNNNIQIAKKRSKLYTGGIHDFEYDHFNGNIKIYSRYRNSAFWVYAYLILPIIPMVLDGDNNNFIILIGIGVLMFLTISIILMVSINNESKEIERELILKINHKRNKIN